MERLYILCLAGLVVAPAMADEPLGPGDHTRTVQVGDLERSYLVHIPAKYDPETPTPVVLVFHGAGTNARMMVPFCAMNEKSDEAGFIAVYPNGTGAAGIFLTWNAGGLHGKMAEGKANAALVKHQSRLLSE
jgi:polyhydroxybutyrate depolymerase